MAEKLSKRVRIVFAILTPLALFYLFVVPMIAALSPSESGALGVAFGAFMLLQLFMLVAMYAIEAAAAFYGLRWRLWPLSIADKLGDRHAPTAGGAVISMFLSYAMLNYAFGVLYVFISRVDPSSFSSGPLSAFAGWYFSILTGATVAFGDIIPKSTAARCAAALQISISVIYVVLLFSASSAHLARRLGKQENSLPVGK